MRKERCDEELARLRAERAIARAELVRTLDGLEARARDPFRLKETIRRHPVLVAGIAAGVGALLVNVFARGREPPPAPTRREEPSSGSDHRSRDLLDALREVALQIATPWLTRLVEKHFGPPRGDRAADGAEPEPTTAQT